LIDIRKAIIAVGVRALRVFYSATNFSGCIHHYVSFGIIRFYFVSLFNRCFGMRKKALDSCVRHDQHGPHCFPSGRWAQYRHKANSCFEIGKVAQRNYSAK